MPTGCGGMTLSWGNGTLITRDRRDRARGAVVICSDQPPVGDRIVPRAVALARAFGAADKPNERVFSRPTRTSHGDSPGVVR
jgi:hypothetical protein